MRDNIGITEHLCVELIKDGRSSIVQKCPKCQHSAKEIKIGIYRCRAKTCRFEFTIKS